MPELLQQKTPGELPLPQAVNAAISSPSNIRSFSITALFVLAFFYTLYFAADFVLPVALALLMSLLLLPLVEFLNKKARIPEAFGSALAIAALSRKCKQTCSSKFITATISASQISIPLTL